MSYKRPNSVLQQFQIKNIVAWVFEGSYDSHISYIINPSTYATLACRDLCHYTHFPPHPPILVFVVSTWWNINLQYCHIKTVLPICTLKKQGVHQCPC